MSKVPNYYYIFKNSGVSAYIRVLMIIFQQNYNDISYNLIRSQQMQPPTSTRNKRVREAPKTER